MKEKERKREKTRHHKKTKKNDKKEEKRKRRRERERERGREREIEKGGCQKRPRRNKGRHSKINRKCPLLAEKEKTGFFSIEAKKAKEKTQK